MSYSLREMKNSELELLRVFLDACSCLNLHPYLVCGSALGAVKYHGFIPWDDDIDVALLRPEYDLFLEKAQEHLPDWCFVQNYQSEPSYPRIYCKLRDTRTTLIENSERFLPVTKGVFIDVFPLDGYPEGKIRSSIFELRKQLYTRSLGCAFEHEGIARRAFYGLFKLMGCHKRTERIATAYERMLKKYPTSESRLWCNHGNWQGRLEYAPREQYGVGAQATFEGLTVQIPELFDEYLTQKYGDWRGDPPEAEQVSHHHFCCYDS